MTRVHRRGAPEAARSETSSQPPKLSAAEPRYERRPTPPTPCTPQTPARSAMSRSSNIVFGKTSVMSSPLADHKASKKVSDSRFGVYGGAAALSGTPSASPFADLKPPVKPIFGAAAVQSSDYLPERKSSSSTKSPATGGDNPFRAAFDALSLPDTRAMSGTTSDTATSNIGSSVSPTVLTPAPSTSTTSQVSSNRSPTPTNTVSHQLSSLPQPTASSNLFGASNVSASGNLFGAQPVAGASSINASAKIETSKESLEQSQEAKSPSSANTGMGFGASHSGVSQPSLFGAAPRSSGSGNAFGSSLFGDRSRTVNTLNLFDSGSGASNFSGPDLFGSARSPSPPTGTSGSTTLPTATGSSNLAHTSFNGFSLVVPGGVSNAGTSAAPSESSLFSNTHTSRPSNFMNSTTSRSNLFDSTTIPIATGSSNLGAPSIGGFGRVVPEGTSNPEASAAPISSTAAQDPSVDSKQLWQMLQQNAETLNYIEKKLAETRRQYTVFAAPLTGLSNSIAGNPVIGSLGSKDTTQSTSNTIDTKENILSGFGRSSPINVSSNPFAVPSLFPSQESAVTGEYVIDGADHFRNITAASAFGKDSFEELRLRDYQNTQHKSNVSSAAGTGILFASKSWGGPGVWYRQSPSWGCKCDVHEAVMNSKVPADVISLAQKLANYIGHYQTNEPYMSIYSTEREHYFIRKVRAAKEKATELAKAAESNPLGLLEISKNDTMFSKIADAEKRFFKDCLATWVLSKHAWQDKYAEFAKEFINNVPSTPDLVFQQRTEIDAWEKNSMQELEREIGDMKEEINSKVKEIREKYELPNDGRAACLRLLSTLEV